MHVHACPHINPRSVNALEATEDAAEADMAGIVLIDNFGNSSGIARFVEQVLGSTCPRVLGGLILNHQVGLINVDAVESALMMEDSAAFVSFPTHHARHSALAEGRDTKAIERAFHVPDPIEGPVAEVIALVKAHDAVLNTGHLSSNEAIRLVQFAAENGVEKILVPSHDFDDETNTQLASLGAMLEFSYFFISEAASTPATHIDSVPTVVTVKTAEEYATAILRVGADKCVMSSDAGSGLLPPPVDVLQTFVGLMLDQGLEKTDIRTMLRENPLSLFGDRIG